MSEDTRISINLPLPMAVAATLTKIIGVAYPTAQMEGLGRSLTFIIPAGARAKAVSKRAGKAEEGDGILREYGPGGITIGTPLDLAAACLHIMETALAEYPEATNYLEQQVHSNKTGKRYTMLFQRAEGKTPAELRTEADHRARAAEAKLHDVWEDAYAAGKRVMVELMSPTHAATETPNPYPKAATE